jgi:hypothetical protein
MPADDDEDLRAQMGEDRYRDFAIRYLTAIGRAPEFAQATVIKYLTPDPEQEERQREAEERQRQKGEFIREVLCAGFKTLRPDVDDPARAKKSTSYWSVAASGAPKSTRSLIRARVKSGMNFMWVARISRVPKPLSRTCEVKAAMSCSP